MSAARRTAAVAAAAALLLSLCLAGCGAEQKHTQTYYTWFDTVTTVTMYGSVQSFDEVCAIVEPILERYHRAGDIYHEYAGEINARTLNDLAGEGPRSVSPELMELLEFGREMYDATDGMCNIAMGSVFSLWHDCREEALSGAPARVPSDAELLYAAQHADIRDMILDTANGTAELADPEMSIDLGAVAKGYAAEKAARALEDAGYEHIALNVGGNVRTVGPKNRREDWTAGIQDPDGETDSAFLLRVSLSGEALVTSGSYQRFYEVGGVRYHHIISPASLHPENQYVSVTVRARDSALADALSTALFNMSYEDGFNRVNLMDGVEACWVYANGQIRYSQGFRQYLVE